MVYCTSPLVQHISPKLYCSYCSCLCLLQHWLPWCTAPVPWCNTYRPGCTVPVFVCCNTDCHGVLHLSLGATHIAQDVLYQSLFVATLIAMMYCTCPLVQHISHRMYCSSLCLLQRRWPRIYYANLRSSQYGSPRMYYASLSCNKYYSGCTMPFYLLQRKSPRMYYANLRSSQHGSPKMYYASVCCNKYRSGCTMPVCICCKADRPGCILWQSCLLQAQCCALRRLCLKEGVEESKIEQIVQLDEYVVSTYRCLCTHFCA